MSDWMWLIKIISRVIPTSVHPQTSLTSRTTQFHFRLLRPGSAAIRSDKRSILIMTWVLDVGYSKLVIKYILACNFSEGPARWPWGHVSQCRGPLTYEITLEDSWYFLAPCRPLKLRTNPVESTNDTSMDDIPTPDVPSPDIPAPNNHSQSVPAPAPSV